MCASHTFTSFYVAHLAQPNESSRRRVVAVTKHLAVAKSKNLLLQKTALLFNTQSYRAAATISQLPYIYQDSCPPGSKTPRLGLIELIFNSINSKRSQPWFPRLHPRLKPIHALHFYLPAIHLIPAGNVQGVKIGASKTQIGYLALG